MCYKAQELKIREIQYSINKQLMVINSVPDACFTPAKKNPNPQEVQTSREDKKEVTRHEKDSKSHGTQRVMTLHLFGGAGK